jgi:hypothetical protein
MKGPNNTSIPLSGQLGVAPSWETGACDVTCQERVSACVLAHVNTSGKHIALWLDGDGALGYGRSTDYPYQEGSFFGNIFSSTPQAYFCNGKDFDQGAVPGRLGVGGNTSAPYTNPFGSGAYCKDRCAAADFPYGSDGYKACNGFTHVVTVWRNFDPNTNYKVCNRYTGLCLDVDHKSTLDGASLIQYHYTGGDNQKWKIKQVSPGKYTFANFFSGKMLDISGANTANGASLIQWQPNGGSNQQWSFTPTGDGYYKFSPGSQPGASLELSNGTTVEGAKVQQWSWTGSGWQQWSITPLPN